MTEIRRIIKFGNSQGITLPKKEFSVGDLVALQHDENGVLIQKVDIVPKEGGK